MIPKKKRFKYRTDQIIKSVRRQPNEVKQRYSSIGWDSVLKHTGKKKGSLRLRNRIKAFYMQYRL